MSVFLSDVDVQFLLDEYRATNCREGKNATILTYNFMRAEPSKRNVREFKVLEVKPYAQYERSVSIVYCEPRRRRKFAITCFEDNLHYILIHQKGRGIIYDSRLDVPCDMKVFAEERRSIEARRSKALAPLAEAPAMPGWKQTP
jgi:hypothetical protein